MAFDMGRNDPADRREIKVWRWPRIEGRPLLHWAHATGYHARTYTPLLDQLSTFANVLAWDMRGHGASAAAGEPGSLHSWAPYYRDLAAVIDAADDPLWLAGHSVGATVSLMAASRRPDKVRGLLLVEPVLLDPVQSLGAFGLRLAHQTHRHRLAALTARRRSRFQSREAAFANYQGRGGFKTWPDEWLQAYVEHGFVEADDGGVMLATPATWESATFAAVEYNAWPAIRRLKCPVIALGGERGSTFSPLSRRLFARLVPRATIEQVPGTTHFVPMEAAEIVVQAARRLVTSRTAPGP